MVPPNFPSLDPYGKRRLWSMGLQGRPNLPPRSYKNCSARSTPPPKVGRLVGQATESRDPRRSRKKICCKNIYRVFGGPTRQWYTIRARAREDDKWGSDVSAAWLAGLYKEVVRWAGQRIGPSASFPFSFYFLFSFLSCQIQNFNSNLIQILWQIRLHIKCSI
jgi:hypothetical protein